MTESEKDRPQGHELSPDLLLRVVDQDTIDGALKLIQTECNFRHVVYHLAFRVNSPTDMPYFKSTYPYSWLGHYVQRQYADIDPVILFGFEQEEPFFWEDLPRNGEPVAAFFEDAFQHGAGRTGFSIPLSDKAQRKALFSVTSDLVEDAWRQQIVDQREMLIKVGDQLHRRAVLEVYGSEDGPSLAPRELECLHWTAKGKDAATIAQILNISEYTVRDYLKSARHKLGCSTIAHAIHEATKRRLIQF